MGWRQDLSKNFLSCNLRFLSSAFDATAVGAAMVGAMEDVDDGPAAGAGSAATDLRARFGGEDCAASASSSCTKPPSISV